MRSNIPSLREMLSRRGYAVEVFDDAPERDLKDAGTTSFLSDNNNQGRRQQNKTPLEANDDDAGKANMLENFIQGIDRAASVENILKRLWGETQTKPLLSRVCRLDGQNSALFLPVQDVVGAQERGRGMPDEPTEWSFEKWDKADSAWKRKHEGTDIMFEALYLPCDKGGAKVYIFNRNVNNVSQEVAFLGELTISRLLETHMGNEYSPTKHWTSILRIRAGVAPHESQDEATSSFTIPDSTFALTQFLACHGYRDPAPKEQSCPPTYHLEVITTEGTLENSKFYMRGDQVAKAQRLHRSAACPGSNEIFILIRISHVLVEPKISFFVNPWQLVVDGCLAANNLAHYHMSFVGKIPQGVDLGKNGSTRPPTAPERRFEKTLGKVRWHRKTASVSTGPGPLSRSHSPQPPVQHLSVTSVEYRYAPLKGYRDIRLFELFAGRDGDSLQGAIKQMPLESCSGYWALSYRWGSELKPHHIRTDDGLVPITASLDAALRRLRSPDRRILIWVDAICIDQQNKNEKVVQLRLMGEIYTRAARVCAWIGNEAANSHQAIQTLIQIVTADQAPNKPWPTSLPPIPDSWKGRKCPPDSDAIWADISSLFQREWFTRAWILQEVILAADVDVYCGRWHISWDDLFHALTICVKANSSFLEERLPTLGRQIPLAAYTVGLTRQLYSNRPLARRKSLLELLEMFSYTSATLQIDKLYALLHLASDGDEAPFRPDYISSPELVFRRYANAFVSRGSALHLLYRAGTAKSFPFCSWAPDWTRRDHPKTISTWYGTRGGFTAAANTQLNVSVSLVDKDTLTARVTFVDTIARVGDVSLWDSDAVAYLNHLHQELHSVIPYPTGESLEDLKFLLPCGGASRPHLDPFTDTMATYQVVAKAVAAQGAQGCANEDAEDSFVDPSDVFDRAAVTTGIKSIDHLVRFLKTPGSTRKGVWKYWHTVAAFSKRLSIAKMAVTQRGYAALVPRDAEPGDDVVLIHGAAVPFLVRTVGESVLSVKIKLIGECYVHGIMYGEGLRLSGVREGAFAFRNVIDLVGE